MISMDKKYKTRDGHDVRILCVDYNSIYIGSCVVGTYKVDGDKEFLTTWSAEGKFGSGRSSGMDLIEVKEKKTINGWVNIYPIDSFVFHDSEREAKEGALSRIIASVPITIEYTEGEGLSDD